MLSKAFIDKESYRVLWVGGTDFESNEINNWESEVESSNLGDFTEAPAQR